MAKKWTPPEAQEQSGFVPPEAASDVKKKVSTESPLGDTELATEQQPMDGGLESPQVEKPKFVAEEVGGSRYEQAGDPLLPNVLTGLAGNIEKKKKELDKLRKESFQTSFSPVSKMGDAPRINPQIQKKEDELERLEDIYKQYESQKKRIDLEYAAEVLGETEQLKKIDTIMEAEKRLEGNIGDFLLRAVSITPTPADFKQTAKYALEQFAEKEIKASADRISERQKQYTKVAEDLNKTAEGEVAELNAQYEAGGMDYETYLSNYTKTIEGYEKERAKVQREYDVQNELTGLYQTSLQDLSIANQLDDLNPIESGVKSFANELIKTPRQVAGLLKSTAPLLQIVGSMSTGGLPVVSSEMYLDAMSPVTDFMSALSNDNLLRIDPDDTKANMIGDVAGQMAKIIPAAAAAPAAGVMVSAGMSFDEMYQTARQEVSEGEAVDMAAIYMPIGALLEYFGAKTAIGVIDKKAAQRAAINIIKEKGLTKLSTREAQEMLKNSLFQELGVNMTREFFEEGTTEAVQGMVQEGIKQAKNVVDGRETFKFDSKDFADQIVESFVYGGIAGAGVAGITTALGSTGKSKYEIYRESLTDPKTFQLLSQKIMNDKSLTDQEKQKAFDVMERDLETINSVEGFDLPPQKQIQAIELITRKKVLEAAIEGKDKSLTKNIQEQIKVIDETLASFNPQVQEVGNEAQQEVQEKTEAVVEKQRVEEATDSETGKVEKAPYVSPAVEQTQSNELVTFTYEKESDIPDVFKDMVSSRGETNGKPIIRVTVPKSLADKELSNAAESTPKDNTSLEMSLESPVVETTAESVTEIDQKVKLQPDKTTEKVKVKPDVSKADSKVKADKTDTKSKTMQKVSESDTNSKKSLPQKIEYNRSKYTVERKEDGTIDKIVSKNGKEVPEFITRRTRQGVKKVKNPAYSKISALADGADTTFDVKKKRDEVVAAALETPQYDAYGLALRTVAAGAKVDPTSIGRETGEKNRKAMLWATGMTKKGKLPSVETLAESIWMEYGEELGISDQDIRDALISIYMSYGSVEDVRTALIDMIDEKAEKYAQQELDAYLSSLTPEEFALYESVEAEKNLTNEEQEEYFKQEFRNQIESLDENERNKLYEQTYEDQLQNELDKGEGDDGSSKRDGERSKEKVADKKTPAETKTTKESEAKTKEEKKQEAFNKIDDIAQKLKDKFKIDLPEGTKKMGYSQEELIDLAAKAAKALAATGIEINEAIRKIVKELVEIGAIAKEDELNYIMEARATIAVENLPKPEQTDKEFGKATKTLRQEAKEKVYGIMNALAPEEVIEDVADQRAGLRKTKEEFEAIAKELVDSGILNPTALVYDLISNPRALQPDEQAALIYYAAIIGNEIDILNDKIAQNIKDGDAEALSANKLLLSEKTAENMRLDQAGVLAGVIQGQSLWIRRLLMNSLYKVSVQESIYKEATGRTTVPAELTEKFKEYEKNLRRLEKEQAEQQKELEKLKGKLRVPKKKESGLPPEKKKRLQELRPKFFGVFNDATRIAAVLVDKEFYEYSKLLLTEAKDDFGTWSKKMIANVGKGVKKHLPEIYKKIGGKGDTKAKVELPHIDQDGELIIPNEFIIDLIEQGYDTIETITPKIVELLKGLNVEATDRQVRDAISNYGKTSELSQEEAQKALRKMGRVGRLLSALEDVQSKLRPLRTGRQRDKLEAQERDLMRKINTALRDLPQTNEQVEAKWATALEAIKKRMNNRIEQIVNQLNTGEKTPRRNPVQLDAEALELKAELDFLQSYLKSIEGKRTFTYEQRVRILTEALKKRKAEYQRKIATKDFAPEGRLEPVSTPQIEKLRDEINELKKEKKELEKAEGITEQKQNERRLKLIEKKIKAAEKTLDEKVFAEVKKTSKPEYNAKVKAAEATLNALNKEIKKLDEYKAFAEKKKLELTKKNLQKSADRYKDMLSKGQFSTEKSPIVKLDEEGRKLKIEQIRWKNKFDLEREKAILAERNVYQRLMDNAIDVLGLPRALMASVDLSAPLRQGFLLSARNPRLAAKAFKAMFQQAFSENKYEQWLDDLEGTEIFQYSRRAGLYIAKPNSVLLAKEEQFITSLASKIPAYGKLVRGSERAYSSYLNVLRMGVFESFYKNMTDTGLDPEVDKDTFKYMAKFINNATGRGDVGGLGVGEKTLNMMFFAPRFVLSRFNILTNAVLFPIAEIDGRLSKYPKVVRREAMKTMLAFASTQALILLLAAAAGADVEDDPRSSDFLKIRIGNLRLDTLASFQQIMRLVATLVAGSKKNPNTGEITDLNTGKFMGKTRADEVFRFGRTKLSPVASTVIDALYAPSDTEIETTAILGELSYTDKVYFRNLMNQDETLGDRFFSLITPLYVSDMKEIYDNEGIPLTAAAFFPALFGIGSQYYTPANNGKNSRDLEMKLEDFKMPELKVEDLDFDTDLDIEL